MTMETRLALTIENVIQDAGFNVGTTTLVNPRTGETRHVVNAVDAKTRESWTVQAASRYEAVVDLAEQVGIELMD